MVTLRDEVDKKMKDIAENTKRNYGDPNMLTAFIEHIANKEARVASAYGSTYINSEK